MPGDQELLRLIDLPSNQKDIEAMMQALTPLVKLIQEVNANPIGKNINGMADYKKSVTELSHGLGQIAEGQKKLIELENQLGAVQKRRDPKTRTDEEIRASVQARNEMKARTDAIKAEEDAYKQLALAYNKAAAEAKKLQAEALKGGDKGAADAATARAKALSDQLKGIDHPVGDDRRNVGNYIDAIKTLEPEIGKLRAELAAMKAAGQQGNAEFQKMTTQLAQLETLTSQQAKGFASVTQELRFNEKALQTLRAAGLENTEAFTHMRQEVAKAREEFREFQEQQKILASDAPLLTSLTVAAKGLAGAYAIGAGATALFANGNEKVEKELNKLVAIMTVLQGLQEAHELLQKRGAIAVAFRAAAEKLRNFVLTGSITALKEKSAAEAMNTVEEEAGTVTTEANTGALEAQTVVMEAATVATEGASRAMAVLRFALLATGIGALLLLLPLVAQGFGFFAKKAEEAAKEALELEEIIDKLNGTLMLQAELQLRYNEEQREGLQSSLDLLEKQGKNFYEIFTIRKRLAEIDQQEAAQRLMAAAHTDNERTAFRKMTDEVEERRGKLDGLLAVQNAFQSYQKDSFSKMSDAGKKQAKEDEERQQKAVDIAKRRYEESLKLLQDYNQKSSALEALDAEFSKFTEEEKRQVALASAEIRANAIMRVNERIVNDERSTQAQILAAMDRSAAAQLQKIAVQKQAIREQAANKEITPAQALMQEQALEDERVAILERSNEEKRKKNYEYYVRDRNARAEILKLEAEDQAKADAAIIADQKATYDQKLKALTEQYNARKASIGADLGKDLDAPGMTDQERKARLAKAESDLLALRIDFAKQYQAIVKDNQEKILKSWEGFYASERSAINIQEAQELIALNNAYGNKLLSTTVYEKKRTEIQRKAAIERAQIEVQEAYLAVNATKEGTIERQKAEEKLSAAVLNLGNLVAGDIEVKAKERKQAIIDSATAVYDLTTGLIDDGFEREKQRIDQSIAENQRKYDEQKKGIADSTLSATQKAAEIQALDAKQAAAQHQLEAQRRQEEQKQAIFDRDAAVLKITANTLVAASAAGWITPAGIAIEIAGAAEVTALLAKPIPHYGVGTDYHPGGPMVVHPGELRVNPDGTVSKTPDGGATLTYGDAGTKIIPADEVRAMMLGDIFAGGQTAYVDRNGDIINSLQDIKQELRRNSQDQVNALRKQRPPEININLDGDFRAHIENSCR